MAIFYALPTLTYWGGNSGWSKTSGGADAGADPGINDTVVFDANSGSGRNITVGANPAYLAGFQNISGKAFSFTAQFGSGEINVNSGTSDIDFSNCTLLPGLALAITGSSTTTPRGLAANGAVFDSIRHNLGNIALLSDLVVNGIYALNSYSTTDSFKPALASRTFNVKLRGLTMGLGSGSIKPALDMGSGTWTITGSDSGEGAVWWDTTVFSTFSGANSTLIFQNRVGNSRRVYAKIAGGQQYGAVWNDCGPMVSLNLQFAANGSLVPRFNLLKASPGSITEFDTVSSSQALYIGSVDINGSGLPISLRGNRTGTSAVAYLAGVAGGFNTVFYANLSNLSFSNPTGVTWRAVRSTNGGSVTGMSFAKDAGSFFPFL